MCLAEKIGPRTTDIDQRPPLHDVSLRVPSVVEEVLFNNFCYELSFTSTLEVCLTSPKSSRLSRLDSRAYRHRQMDGRSRRPLGKR